MKLKTYLIFTYKNSNKFEIIEEKFSLIAMMFPILWMLYNKMFKLTIYIFSLIFAINWLFNNIGLENYSWIPVILLNLVAGFASSEIKQFFLESQGYNMKKIIMAYSQDEAKIKYLSQRYS